MWERNISKSILICPMKWQNGRSQLSKPHMTNCTESLKSSENDGQLMLLNDSHVLEWEVDTPKVDQNIFKWKHISSWEPSFLSSSSYSNQQQLLDSAVSQEMFLFLSQYCHQQERCHRISFSQLLPHSRFLPDIATVNLHSNCRRTGHYGVPNYCSPFFSSYAYFFSSLVFSDNFGFEQNCSTNQNGPLKHYSSTWQEVRLSEWRQIW